MDALSPSHPARRVVFMKGAQVGATTVGSNWIGYVIHHAPGPMLAVQPTTELAKRFSEQRIEPLVEETPAIRERVAPARSRDSGNRQLSKEFPGGQLVMTGANSAVGLRSMSARFLFLDEIDAYPGDVEGEGDPIALAEARARTFGWRRKLFLVSTPTIAGLSRIEREFLATDQRRYFVPCPHCGHRQHLRFERLVWEEDAPETARYLCEACEQPIGEQHKARMLAAGEWRPTAEAEDPQAIGFHISALYSPPGWLSWAEIARLWRKAQGDDRAIKTFRNTVLGETWQEAGEAPDWQRLYDRREHWPAGTVPMGGLLLTAGVDVQRDRLEASVWAWGQDRQSWLIEHRVLAGNPFEGAVWEDLRLLLGETWRHESSHRLPIAMAAIDSGDGMTTAEVYAFVRRAGAGRAIAVKGQDSLRAAVGQPAATEVRRNGRKPPRRAATPSRRASCICPCMPRARSSAASSAPSSWSRAPTAVVSGGSNGSRRASATRRWTAASMPAPPPPRSAWTAGAKGDGRGWPMRWRCLRVRRCQRPRRRRQPMPPRPC
jgi:phage terminase large subunit GpA-like protein